MRSDDLIAVAIFALSVSACSSNSSVNLPPSCSASASGNVVNASTPAPGIPGVGNVMRISVNGSTCSPDINQQYPNEICVAITLCDVGTTNCMTIDNLLLDTGSYGIRIYDSVLTGAYYGSSAHLNTNAAAVPATGGGTLSECVGFGDGSSEWGRVGKFDVQFTDSSEKVANVPVLMIDSSYSTPPPACNASNSFPDTDPGDTGFNGIVGVGLFDRDCGTYCAAYADAGQYYACNGTTCTGPGPNGGSVAPLGDQVRNPVAGLSTDNNGVILQLPGVPDGGAASVEGYMILGIGTKSNNTPTNVQGYPADLSGTFSTVFNPFSSSSLSSFIDSGSSLLFFPWPPPATPQARTMVPECGGGLTGFYCPSGSRSFAATNTGHGGAPTSCVPFNSANANSLLSASNNMVYSNLTGTSGSDIYSDFDWGLPFFLGRKVYVGIRGKSVPGLGTGPLWAY